MLGELIVGLLGKLCACMSLWAFVTDFKLTDFELTEPVKRVNALMYLRGLFNLSPGAGMLNG